MSLISTILVTLTALEFFYILYLETFATTSDATSRVFNMSKEELQRKSVGNLFKNQGVYNGLVGLGLLYGAFIAAATVEVTVLFLIYIILVALYGAITVDKKIILTQGGLAILSLITIIIL